MYDCVEVPILPSGVYLTILLARAGTVGEGDKLVKVIKLLFGYHGNLNPETHIYIINS